MSVIDLKIEGIPQAERLLARYQQPSLYKRAQTAMDLAGRTILKPAIKAEAPRRTGTLRKSVASRKGRTERPSVVVGPRGKKAYYRHMVIGGTRRHEMPTRRGRGPMAFGGNVYAHVNHPGIRPNPFVERAARGKVDDVARLFATYMESSRD